MGSLRVTGRVACWLSALGLAVFVLVSLTGGYTDDLAVFARDVGQVSALVAIAAFLADRSDPR